MSTCRTPGVLCTELNESLPANDAGTLARTSTASPGTVTGASDGGAAANEEVFVNPNYATINASIDNGFCVPLVQFRTKVGTTSTWRAGTALTAKPDLEAGTIIATFNTEGKYASNARGNHAAYFVEYKTQDGVEGIVIFDQYREWPDKEQKEITDLEAQRTKLLTNQGNAHPSTLTALSGQIQDARKKMETNYPEVDDKNRRFRRKQPGKRFLPFGKGTVSNNASAYSVVTH